MSIKPNCGIVLPKENVAIDFCITSEVTAKNKEFKFQQKAEYVLSLSGLVTFTFGGYGKILIS